MVEKTVIVGLPEGLHARPASEFVKTAARFTSQVQVGKNGQFADAKSILGVMSLAVAKGQELAIRASGEDEAQAVEMLTHIVTKGES